MAPFTSLLFFIDGNAQSHKIHSGIYSCSVLYVYVLTNCLYIDKMEVEPVASRDICEDELGTFLSPPAALILRQDVKTISQIYIIMFEK